MVTVDPEVDTDEVLTNYVTSFFPDGRGFRTDDPELLAAAAEPFGAAYEIIDAADGGREVLHTAHLYLVDGQGRLVVQWPFGQSAQDMASDVRIALDSQ